MVLRGKLPYNSKKNPLQQITKLHIKYWKPPKVLKNTYYTANKSWKEYNFGGTGGTGPIFPQRFVESKVLYYIQLSVAVELMALFLNLANEIVVYGLLLTNEMVTHFLV